jgi:hypothetical protein
VDRNHAKAEYAEAQWVGLCDALLGTSEGDRQKQIHLAQKSVW